MKFGRSFLVERPLSMEQTSTVCITSALERFKDALRRAAVVVANCPMQCCCFGNLVIEFKPFVFEQKVESRVSRTFICDNCLFFIVLNFFLDNDVLRILQEDGGETFISGGGGIEKDTKSLVTAADARNEIRLEETDKSVPPCLDNFVDPMKGKMVKDLENEVVW